MKMTVGRITFNDRAEILDALNGYKWKAIVEEIDQLLRNDNKHGKGKMKSQAVRDRLWEAINERGLDLY